MCNCAITANSVGTCPECLPVGSITWLIENGRQLELLGFEEGMVSMRPGDCDDEYAQDSSESLKEVRLLDPQF